MSRRVLIAGAGTGPANNLMRSLRVGDPSIAVIGCHSDRFVLKQSPAERNYLVSPSTHPAFCDGLRRIVDAEQLDLIIPTTDQDVGAMARLHEALAGRLFLPQLSTIELCRDKYALSSFLRERGLPVPVTYPVVAIEDIDRLFHRLAVDSRVWCRLRVGQGGMGAIPVTSPQQARHWIMLWHEIRGVAATAFAMSEYLPGRDVAAQTLWDRGRLVLLKTYERLSYLGAGNPRGFSSIASLSKTVCDPRIAETCSRAIRAIDPEASGIFVFDFKEDADGTPCITEINAGRFGMSTNMFDLAGKHNMVVTYVQLACGDTVDIGDPYDVAEEYYMVRDVDTAPGVYHADELFEGIEDVRS